MPRRREFTTATQRRKLEPIEWVIDDQSFRLRPDLTITDLADLSEVLLNVGQGMPEIEAGERPSPEQAAQLMRATQRLVDQIVDALRPLLIPPDREHWPAYGRMLSPEDLVSLVFDLVEEATGKNPSSPSGSSIPSEPAGTSSTGGALHGALTPPLSPPTDA